MTSRTKVLTILLAALLVAIIIIAIKATILLVSPPAVSKLPEHDAIAFLKEKGLIPAGASVGYAHIPVMTTCYPVSWSERGLADPFIHRELICAPIDGVFPRADVKGAEKK